MIGFFSFIQKNTSLNVAKMSGLLSVNLEHGERWWYAHVSELHGCFTRAETRREALVQLPGEINRHIKFLEDHGVRPSFSSLNFSVVEEAADIPELGEAGGAVALFASDLKPVENSEFTVFLSLMRWNREELLGIVEHLSVRELIAYAIPGKWSIDQTLRHMGNAERWYVSRLGINAELIYAGFERRLRKGRRKIQSLELLKLVRESATNALEAVFQSQPVGAFRRRAYTRHPDESWTLRKVLRRFVEHEREHISTIRKVIIALEGFQPH